jgi:hypothetical protein
MAYDRYDPRDRSRDENSRWRDDRGDPRSSSGSGGRGFFERAGDEIASWFGDDDADRRRHRDERMGDHDHHRHDHDWRRDNRSDNFARDRDWNDRNDRSDRNSWTRDDDRGFMSGHGYRSQGGDFSRDQYRQSDFGGTSNFDRSARGYQPMFGGYTAAEGLSNVDNSARRDFGRDWESGNQRSRFSSERDPHYHSWRQRQMDDLDRDYDDYRRENQSKFESDFGSWRERRMQKRGMLGQIREHMEVVGNDDQHVGTVDRTAGDRVILTKSDPESGGVHHSLSCSEIDRIDNDKIVLDCSADEARNRWRDESRSRALFEREDQGEMGDRALNHSFQGTYR